MKNAIEMLTHSNWTSGHFLRDKTKGIGEIDIENPRRKKKTKIKMSEDAPEPCVSPFGQFVKAFNTSSTDDFQRREASKNGAQHVLVSSRRA